MTLGPSRKLGVFYMYNSDATNLEPEAFKFTCSDTNTRIRMSRSNESYQGEEPLRDLWVEAVMPELRLR